MAGTGENRQLRFADRTRVAAGVLFATNCDLTVHLEELQHLARDVSEHRPGTHSSHPSGIKRMDRERRSLRGGGPPDAGFHVVCFGTAEVDVTMKLPPVRGA